VTTQYVTVTDEGKGAEFAWRLKGQALIDEYALPNVQSIRILDTPAMTDKKIMRSLPKRSLFAKHGRVVDLQGWTDSQIEVDALEALADGVRRMFLHPSGDSFAVRVKTVAPKTPVEKVGRRIYRLLLNEVR
jgi:hypothetical protein